MTETSNEKKTIYFSNFLRCWRLIKWIYKFFGEKFKNWGKLIQSGIPGRHTRNRVCPGKTGTVRVFVIIAINFISSKDVDEEHVLHLYSNNTEFMPYDNVNEFVMQFSSHFFQDTKLVRNINERKWFYFWLNSTVLL